MLVLRLKLKEIKVEFINIFFFWKNQNVWVSDSACEIHPSGNSALLFTTKTMSLTFSLTTMFLDQLKEFILLCQTHPDVLQREDLAFFLDFCTSWSQIQSFRKLNQTSSDGPSIKVCKEEDKKPKEDDSKDTNNEMQMFGFQMDEARNYLDVIVKEEGDNNSNNQDQPGGVPDFYDSEEETVKKPKPKRKYNVKVKKEKEKKEVSLTKNGKVKRERKYVYVPGATSTQCPECGDVLSSGGALVLHIRARHQGVKYPCDQCDAVYTTMGNLKVHISSKHDKKRWQCEYCEYQPTKKLLLAKHIQAKHSGIKLKCDQCNYETAKRENLKIHVKTVHEGVRFTCEHCGYQAMRRENLRAHIRDLHMNLTFFCNKCQFQTNRKRKLNEHLRQQHLEFLTEVENDLNHPSLSTTVKNNNPNQLPAESVTNS